MRLEGLDEREAAVLFLAAAFVRPAGGALLLRDAPRERDELLVALVLGPEPATIRL